MAISFLLPLVLLGRPDGGAANLKTDIEAYFRKDGWRSFAWKSSSSNYASASMGPIRGLYLQVNYRDYGSMRPQEADPSRTYIQLASKVVEQASGKNWRLSLEDYSFSQRHENKPFKVLVRVFFYRGREGGFVDLLSSPYVGNEQPSFTETLHKDATKALEGLFQSLKSKFQSK